MKKILFLLALAFIAIPGFSQVQIPVSGLTAEFSQMWNPLNVYSNAVTNGGQLGTQTDVVTNTGVVNTYTSNFFFNGTYTLPNNPTKAYSTITNTDSVVVAPVSGYGTITLTASVLKLTGTATINVTPVSSSDGVIWSPIPTAANTGNLTVAVVPTSTVTPVVTKFIFATKPDRYLGIQYTGIGTQTSQVQSYYYFNRLGEYTK